MAALRPFALARLNAARLTSQPAEGYVPACKLTVELVSFPTPAGTIMVRAIPGFPGTLMEVPLELVAGSPARFTTVVHYARIVAAPGAQPLRELLALEGAVPVNFTLANDGTPELDAWGAEWPSGGGLIIARTCSDLANQAAAAARFAAAGWTLEPITSEEL